MEQIKNYYRWCRLRDIRALRNFINQVREKAKTDPTELSKEDLALAYSLCELMKKAYREDYPKDKSKKAKVNIDK